MNPYRQDMRLTALAFAEAGLIASIRECEQMAFQTVLEYNIRLQWKSQERDEQAKRNARNAKRKR